MRCIQWGCVLFIYQGRGIDSAGCWRNSQAYQKKNILLEIITNGVLTTKHLPLLKETLDFICISIDGNEQITDENRGKGVYAKALETVRACRDAGIVTRVNGVLSEKPRIL